jgi:uncharacterized protein
MLGSLTRWLRLLGFDAAYVGSQLDDGQVLDWARQDGRFLVSCDQELVQRAMRADVPSLLLRPGPVQDQLLILLAHAGVALDPERYFTRCTACGEALKLANKGVVDEEVPPSVRALHTTFWRCPNCRKIYWEGSHVDAIEKQVFDLLRRLQEEKQRHAHG